MLARRMFAAFGLALVLASAGAPLVALADDVDPEAVDDARDAAESRSATFQAVTGGQGEDVPGGPLLVMAYGAVLVLVLGYVLYLGRLTAGTSRDLERLERAIEARMPEYRKSARGEEIAKELSPGPASASTPAPASTAAATSAPAATSAGDAAGDTD